MRLNQSIKREKGETLFIGIVTLFPQKSQEKQKDNQMTNHQFIRSVQGAVHRENKSKLLLFLFFNRKKKIEKISTWMEEAKKKKVGRDDIINEQD